MDRIFPAYADTKGRVLVSPSILAADAAAFGRDIERVSRVCDLIHVDVMDGAFVPNISFGIPVLKAIRGHSHVPLDVHLMIERPERYIEAFAEAGADLITVHVETCPHLHRVIQQIRAAGVGVGVTLNPATPLSALEEVLDLTDLFLIMSVNPGFGGQAYIPSSTGKIRRLRQMLEARGLAAHIEVDGGVGIRNAAQIVEAGANVLVAGSAVFNAENPEAAVRALQNCRA